MLELTRFFGITIEQLITEQKENAAVPEEEQKEEEAEIPENMEVRDMTVQQLIQMAPFMSKEGVEEIAMGIGDKIPAAELAKLAPFIRQEALAALLEKHAPELDWDVLRKLAPFMSREAVDELARRIASGEAKVNPAVDPFNKTMNDIGKAFDDFGRGAEKTAKEIGKGLEKTFDEIGRGMDKAFRKAKRIGSRVKREVSKSFSCDEEEVVVEPTVRSERMQGIRKKAFERALADGKWEWLGMHIAEIRSDGEMMAMIAASAKENGRRDFIRAHMSEYADMQTIDEAIAAGEWEWLGENVWQYDADVQEKIAVAATAEQKWQWIYDYSDPMELVNCPEEIAEAAMLAGENKLLGRFADMHLVEGQCDALAERALEAENFGALDALLAHCSPSFREKVLYGLAEKAEWSRIANYVQHADGEILEKLMEIAVEQGNFDAIDLLDALI